MATIAVNTSRALRSILVGESRMVSAPIPLGFLSHSRRNSSSSSSCSILFGRSYIRNLLIIMFKPLLTQPSAREYHPSQEGGGGERGGGSRGEAPNATKSPHFESLMTRPFLTRPTAFLFKRNFLPTFPVSLESEQVSETCRETK